MDNLFVCLFSRFLFRYVPCKFTHTILQKITKTRPIFHEWIDRRHISFIRFLVTSDGYNQKTSSNKLTFVRLHFHYCVIYGGKTLFWVAVGCGLWRPSRPILKLRLVIDGGFQFGEGMEFSPCRTRFAMAGPLVSVSGFIVVQVQSGGNPLIELL